MIALEQDLERREGMAVADFQSGMILSRDASKRLVAAPQ